MHIFLASSYTVRHEEKTKAIITPSALDNKMSLSSNGLFSSPQPQVLLRGTTSPLHCPAALSPRTRTAPSRPLTSFGSSAASAGQVPCYPRTGESHITPCVLRFRGMINVPVIKIFIAYSYY